jgi:hypothetical protein
MAATAAQIAQVRRMVGEPSETTYTDADIQEYIETYPLLDERGEEPYTWDSSTQPPTQDENEDWIDTYDLAAAAADIWDEKAAVVVQDYDFSADGGSFKRSQVAEQYSGRARYYRSRRAPRTRTMFMSPDPGGSQQEWIGNLAEED